MSTAEGDRRAAILAWLGIEAAYLRLCRTAGYDPGLHDPAVHDAEQLRDFARFTRELGGMEATLDALFRPEDTTERGWFRILAGEGDA